MSSFPKATFRHIDSDTWADKYHPFPVWSKREGSSAYEPGDYLVDLHFSTDYDGYRIDLRFTIRRGDPSARVVVRLHGNLDDHREYTFPRIDQARSFIQAILDHPWNHIARRVVQ